MTKCAKCKKQIEKGKEKVIERKYHCKDCFYKVKYNQPDEITSYGVKQ